MLRRILVGFVVGGLIGAILTAGTFFVLASLDGTRSDEAFAYSLLVGVIGGFLGGVIGAIVGLGNMRWPAGALVGLVTAMLLVALYMSSFGGEATFMQLLNRSRVIIVIMTAPLILTGVIAALANKALNNRE